MEERIPNGPTVWEPMQEEDDVRICGVVDFVLVDDKVPKNTSKVSELMLPVDGIR